MRRLRTKENRIIEDPRFFKKSNTFEKAGQACVPIHLNSKLLLMNRESTKIIKITTFVIFGTLGHLCDLSNQCVVSLFFAKIFSNSRTVNLLIK